MATLRQSRALRRWSAVAALLCLAALARAQEGTYDWRKAQTLSPGLEHAKLRAESPRPMNINCLRVDTRTPGLTFITTPRCEPWVRDVAETVRKTVRQFMQETRAVGKPVVAAVNADAWTPWIVLTWNQPTRPNLKGLAVSDGVLVSPGSGTPSLIIHKDGTAEIATTHAFTDISSIQTAVSGFALVLLHGEAIPGGPELHPRTGAGISEDGRWVYLMTIDGRQTASGGATTQEVGAWLRHFGAYTGINMDGGGSTTMAWWDPLHTGPDKSTLLNVPVGGGAPGSERYTANNLGVCYQKPAR